ncbi:uncharacterized protein LOC131737979 isoform X2 [Acipenser ruthenus]|uniref:uncharacterized protein LOC131737979 isoform X2 n=1 Tax=Acipenser ruthenus TaxID=7906 RepID=UPI002740A166|nr:uncharacterized protein LOC131737979 isoform X2 [Acipenser ruthenus]
MLRRGQAMLPFFLLAWVLKLTQAHALAYDVLQDQAAANSADQRWQSFDHMFAETESDAADYGLLDFSQHYSTVAPADKSTSEGGLTTLVSATTCGVTDMTIKLSGGRLTDLKVRVAIILVEVSKIARRCRYKLLEKKGVVIFTTAFKGCNVKARGGQYVLTLMWRNNYVHMSCPVPTPDRPITICGKSSMTITLPAGPVEALRVKNKFNKWVSIYEVAVKCKYQLLRDSEGRITFTTSYNGCHVRRSMDRYFYNIYYQMAPGKLGQALMSCRTGINVTVPTEESLPSVFCAKSGMMIKLPKGSLNAVKVRDGSGKTIPVDSVAKNCNYQLFQMKTGHIILIASFQSCQIAFVNGNYVLAIIYTTYSGDFASVQIECPTSGEPTKPPPSTKPIPPTPVCGASSMMVELPEGPLQQVKIRSEDLFYDGNYILTLLYTTTAGKRGYVHMRCPTIALTTTNTKLTKTTRTSAGESNRRARRNAGDETQDHALSLRGCNQDDAQGLWGCNQDDAQGLWGCNQDDEKRLWGCNQDDTRSWGCNQDNMKGLWGCNQDDTKGLWGCNQDDTKGLWGYNQDDAQRLWGCNQDDEKRLWGCNQDDTRSWGCNQDNTKGLWGCNQDDTKGLWGYNQDDAQGLWGCNQDDEKRFWGCNQDDTQELWGCNQDDEKRLWGCNQDDAQGLWGCNQDDEKRLWGCNQNDEKRLWGCNQDDTHSWECNQDNTKGLWGCNQDNTKGLWGCNQDDEKRFWGCNQDNTKGLWGCNQDNTKGLWGCNQDDEKRLWGCNLDNTKRLWGCNQNNTKGLWGCNQDDAQGF